MNKMQRVRRKYAINRSKKKSFHKGNAKQRQSLKRGYSHAKGDLPTQFPQPRKEKGRVSALLFFNPLPRSSSSCSSVFQTKIAKNRKATTSFSLRCQPFFLDCKSSWSSWSVQRLPWLKSQKFANSLLRWICFWRLQIALVVLVHQTRKSSQTHLCERNVF